MRQVRVKLREVRGSRLDRFFFSVVSGSDSVVIG
jgi:hypothetical protein